MVVEASWIGWSSRDPETFVHVAPDLTFPKYLDALVIGEEDIEVDLKISGVFDQHLERYVADRVDVRRRGPAGDVSGAALRDLKIHTYLRTAIQNAIRGSIGREDSPLAGVLFELEPVEAVRIRAQGPSSEEALLWTARIYKFAVAVGESPARAVQQQLTLSVPTASVWIRRARDRGFLVDPIRTTSEDDLRAFDALRDAQGYEDWN